MKINRREEIFLDFLLFIDNHLKDIIDGKKEEMYELQEVADYLHIHPTHLSNVIKEYSGKHPCYFYEQKLLEVAKKLLKDRDKSIAEVARMLTFGPSNFTKWFKHYQGITPSVFRSLAENEDGSEPAFSKNDPGISFIQAIREF